jgi:hypothetical protein
MLLASGLPIELICEILVSGIADPHKGKSFGARCMRISRWVQPIVARPLYDTVLIETEAQMRSFLLALDCGKEQDRDKEVAGESGGKDRSRSRGDDVRRLVRSLVIPDTDLASDSAQCDKAFWASAILDITQTLDRSTWKEFYVSCEWMTERFTPSPTTPTAPIAKYRMPRSYVTYPVSNPNLWIAQA